MLRHFKSLTEIISTEKHVTVWQIIVLAEYAQKKNEAFSTEDSNIPQPVMEIAKRFITNISIRFRDKEDNKRFENLHIQKPSIWDEFDLEVVDVVKKQNPTADAIIVDKYFINL